MKATWLFVAGVLALAVPAAAQDRFEGVEYISGRAGMAKKVKGQLTIDEHAVSFGDSKGKPLFSIPMAEIDKAEAGAQHEEGSFGRKMALGIFAGKNVEYLQLQTHNATSAEGLVFKVKKQTGAGMAAKVNYWSGKAHGAMPAAAPASPPQPPDHVLDR
jgi:hypothetical protein